VIELNRGPQLFLRVKSVKGIECIHPGRPTASARGPSSGDSKPCFEKKMEAGKKNACHDDSF
jgi:hypothetical protein